MKINFKSNMSIKQLLMVCLFGCLFLVNNDVNAQCPNGPCGDELLRNVDFDTATSTCTDPQYSTIMYFDTSPLKDWWGAYLWTTPTSTFTGSPDYYNAACTNAGTLRPDNGNNNNISCNAGSGVIASFANNWEYIQSELKEPLKAGVQYCLKVELIAGFGGGFHGAVWFGNSKKQHSGQVVYPGMSDVRIDDNGGFGCSDAFVTYCATGGETWIMLGPENNTDAFNLESISLREHCNTGIDIALAAVSDSILCGNTCTDITATVTGGAANPIITWITPTLTGTGPHSVCPTSDSVFAVAVEAQGNCVGLTGPARDTAYVTIAVEQNCNGCPPFPAFTDSVYIDVCGSNSTNGIAIISPNLVGSGYSYSWNPSGQITATATGLTAGTTYTCTITNDTMTTCTMDIVVTIPSLIAPVTTNLSTSICPGGSVFLGGAMQTIAGIYNDTITSILTGCDSILITTLTINPIFNINASASICDGDNIMLGGALQTTAGIYVDSLNSTVTGCDSIISTTLTINMSTIDTVIVSICNGESILIGTQEEDTEGFYQSKFTNSLGCDSTIVTNLKLDALPIVIVTADTSIKLGETIELFVEGGATYAWSPSESLSCDDCDNPIASPEETTDYIVITSSIKGCKVSNTVVVSILITDLNIPSAFTPDNDGFNDFWVIQGIEQYPNATVKVLNRWGVEVFSTDKNYFGNEWDGESLPVGSYFYVIELNSDSVEEDKSKFKGNVSIIK